MLDLNNCLVLTPINAQNEENVLYLDPDRIIGLLGFPNATNLFLDIAGAHSVFSVKESVENIKQQLDKLADAQK